MKIEHDQLGELIKSLDIAARGVVPMSVSRSQVERPRIVHLFRLSSNVIGI